MKARVRAVLLATATIALAGAVGATPISYSGSNNPGDGSWNRPIGGGPIISTLGPVNYSVQPFFTDESGFYTFDSTQDYDGYIHVYGVSFDPTDQLANLLAGNDDGPGSAGTSQIVDLALNASTQYFLVTSAYEAGDVGTFTNTITDASQSATIELGELRDMSIPAPATAMLLMLGLAGFAFRSARCELSPERAA